MNSPRVHGPAAGRAPVVGDDLRRSGGEFIEGVLDLREEQG